MKNNSVIFKNPEDDHLIDLSYLGTILRENTDIQITQKHHFFVPGDVLAYDLQKQQFVRALAVNTVQSEACGVVSEYIDADNFILVARGPVHAPQYNFAHGSTLWLSEVIPGKLMSIAPTKTFKQIAIQTSDGIIEVDVKMGFTIGSVKPEPLEPGSYTKAELDEIIANVM